MAQFKKKDDYATEKMKLPSALLVCSLLPIGTLVLTRVLEHMPLLIHPWMPTWVFVVYMGSTDNEDPNEIVFRNHRILSSVHSGSFEDAHAAHLYSYKHGFKGFAAKLTQDQALQIAKMEGVVSAFLAE
ncbi:hypothetical protein SSX86_010733 [Deinandra increscens subsp. villosa]|uniref:Inhibitor I9 domain-containing protein n=1 Tax=Deinandra increscens subsp. villosa TaxID=3103831 RepID=A0AAP0H3G8_9ASTR